jgi:hypothetical protein
VPKGSVPALQRRASFLLPLAFILGLGLSYVRAVPASGDEVEYLLLAQSLWREHDLDLADNFKRGDHLEYTHDLREMPYGTWRADGRPISTHSVGLPLLLAPFYAAGGRAACVVLMALCAEALMALVYRFALEMTGDADAALTAWLLAASPPLFFYGFHIYTEAPSALLVFAAFLLLRRPGGMARAVLAAACVGALPLLHVKMIPAMAVLALMGLARLRGRERFAFGCIVAGFLAAYALHHYRVFGDPSPLSLYGSKVPRKIQRSSPWLSLPGLFLDGAFGLLPIAPAFLLGLAGAASWWRRRGAARYWAAALVVALVLPVLLWRTWWAGFCPPARFLVPLVPFLAIAAACRVAEWKGGFARFRYLLLGWGLALALYMSARPDARLLLPDRAGPAPIWEALSFGGVSLNAVLPRLTPQALTPGRAVFWSLVVIVILLLDARRGNQSRHAVVKTT